MEQSLFAELKRRRVVRALVGYAVAAFAVLQIIEPVMHGLHWPEATLSYVVVALAAGFPVVVALAWIFDVKAGRIERTSGAPIAKRHALVLAALGVLAAAPGLVWYFALRSRAQTPAGPPSIAVLPFVDMSPQKDQEYFSDGLTEELLNLMSNVPGLRVAARTSSFAFKGKNEDVVSIAEKLHVGAVLEGSVRKAGDRIRITTQLVNAQSGYHLWSETFDRQLTDVFAVQEEIARSVVSALKLALLHEPAAIERQTRNPDAYNEYLLGRYFFNRNDVDGFRRSVKALRKSVEIDAGFAPGWASLAVAEFWAADSADSASEVAAGQARALAAADRAIELAPNLFDGYLARGFVRASINYDWEGSRADLSRAMALAPDNADVLFTQAVAVQRPIGNVSAALQNLRRTSVLDPLNARVWSAYGNTLNLAGDFAAAREALNRSLEISPQQAFTPMHLAIGYLMEGDAAAALAASQRSTNAIFRLTGAALAQHDLHREKEARQALEELIRSYGFSGAYQIAEVFAWFGEKDRSFEWLERARAQHDGGLGFVKLDPLLKNLRGDPRYRQTLVNLRLPPD